MNEKCICCLPFGSSLPVSLQAQPPAITHSQPGATMDQAVAAPQKTEQLKHYKASQIPLFISRLKELNQALNPSAARPYFEYKHQRVTSRRRDFTSNPIYIVWSARETNALNPCRGNLGAVSQAEHLAFAGQASSASPGAVTLTWAGHLGHSWLASVIPHTGAPQL